jgi:dissimilatory sulfite reductase (desulfoviridin) alpha/beta subunit
MEMFGVTGAAVQISGIDATFLLSRMLNCTKMSENKCATCTELRRAATTAVQSSHEAYLLVLGAINGKDESNVESLLRMAAEQSEAKLAIVDAYMKHLQMHCDEGEESEPFAAQR